METISILWGFEDLACDWSENDEHSRHILGVHGFRSFIVIYWYWFLCILLFSADNSVNLWYFSCVRESKNSDDQVQNCAEDFLQVLTSILSEKR